MSATIYQYADVGTPETVDRLFRVTDQEQAARDIAEALGGALGAEVQVKPAKHGGYRAELSFSGADEALELAARIGGRGAISSVG